MTRADEEAAIAQAVSAGRVTRCPTVRPEDAAVDGMLAAAKRKGRMAGMIDKSWQKRPRGSGNAAG